MSKEKESPTFVAYNHVTGVPHLVDKESRTLAPIPLNLPEGKEALKNESGYYRTEVKQEAKRLYLSGLTLAEIVERLGVPVDTVNNWVYKRDGWVQEKRRLIAEARQKNEEVYAAVERQALSRVEEYLKSPLSEIKDAQMFSQFASGVDKLSKAVTPKATPQERSPSATQVNVNVTPLTPAEARTFIENDPIKRIAQARTREEASQALVDAEVVPTPTKR